MADGMRCGTIGSLGEHSRVVSPCVRSRHTMMLLGEGSPVKRVLFSTESESCSVVAFLRCSHRVGLGAITIVSGSHLYPQPQMMTPCRLRAPFS